MKILSINISRKKGTKKKPVNEAVVVAGKGIIGDAHFGQTERQISMLSIESINKMRSSGVNINPGDLAENITVDKSLEFLKIGDVLKVDKVILKLTQIGKKCHTECEIKKLVGKCAMPREGYFFKVLKGGKIRVGNEIKLLPP